MSKSAAQILAKFATDLDFSDLPLAVVESAKNCIIDTVAVCTFGSQFPWARMVADYVNRYGRGGPCSVIGFPDIKVHAPYAALANGVFAHAFEQDGSCEPNVGVHPGGTVVPALLAASEEANADGKAAISAFVAGIEVLLRIGAATHNSEVPPETLGFHAPGIVGPFGSAVAAARILGLNSDQLAHSLGIAGSLASGLLAFTKSKQGGMVKRLHIGRTAESGFLAARLAGAGYTGPETVLEGKFGLLETYCRGASPQMLTAELNSDWHTLRLSMKRYPCAMFAHTAVQGLRELMAKHGFVGAEVARIMIEGADKLVTHNNITEPNDLMQAQYSVPFCVALALFRDPEDPKSFAVNAVDDPAIRTACRNVVKVQRRDQQGHSFYSTFITVWLKDGRQFSQNTESFKGQPAQPLSNEDLRRKFMRLTAHTDQSAASKLYDRLEQLDAQPRFSLT